MPALYMIVTAEGKVVAEYPEAMTFAEAQDTCKKEWAHGLEVYMKPWTPVRTATDYLSAAAASLGDVPIGGHD